jgi:hypothetical protein
LVLVTGQLHSPAPYHLPGPAPTTSLKRVTTPGLYHQLIQFSYLQLLDYLTTVAFLTHGVEEANPLVIWFMRFANNAMIGLFLVKILALGLAIYCWRAGRARLLLKINLLFAAVVVWNIVALITNTA